MGGGWASVALRGVAACWLGVALLGVWSCIPPEPTYKSRAALPRSAAFWERMAFFMVGDTRVRLKGFDGAVPPGTAVALLDVQGATQATATADEHGRFEMDADAHPDQTFLVRPAIANVLPLEFGARNSKDAVRQSLVARLAGTGSTPNQVLVAPDGPVTGDTAAFVVLSGDNALDNVSMDEGQRRSPLVPFDDVASPAGPLTASPWRATLAGSRAWVTRYGQGTLSAVDTNTGQVLGTSNPLPLQTLVPPLSLNPPADANGDGVEESQANQLLPRHPTDVCVVDNVAYVALANVLTTSASGQSQYGPGMLAAFNLDAQGAPNGNARVTTLSFANPQAVVPHPDGSHVVVSSTGALHRSGTWEAQSDGGLDLVNTRDLAVARTLNLQRFAPSRPLVLPGKDALYVPSLLRAQLARVDLETFAVTHGPGGPEEAIRLLDTDDLRSVFECAQHATGLVMCPVFDSDALVFVDPRHNSVNPWPFVEPVVIPEDTQGVRWGFQSLAVRPGRNGVDRVGVDVVLLFSLASRVSAMDTRWVFGP
jgi:hypothetical protein